MEKNYSYLFFVLNKIGLKMPTALRAPLHYDITTAAVLVFVLALLGCRSSPVVSGPYTPLTVFIATSLYVRRTKEREDHRL